MRRVNLLLPRKVTPLCVKYPPMYATLKEIAETLTQTEGKRYTVEAVRKIEKAARQKFKAGMIAAGYTPEVVSVLLAPDSKCFSEGLSL